MKNESEMALEVRARWTAVQNLVATYHKKFLKQLNSICSKSYPIKNDPI